MYSQRHGPEAGLVGVKKAQPSFRVEGRSHRTPRFEAFCGGSWWDVDILEQRDKYYLVSYLSNRAEEEEAWLPLRHLRLRTRKTDDWDCHILKRGFEISVYGIHSDHEDLILDPNELYDARITQLSRAPHDMITRLSGALHDMKCTCKFLVNFFSVRSVRDEEDPSVDRTLLNRVFATREIDISQVSILQKPVNFTVEEILGTHMEHTVERRVRWSNDTFFLPETTLTVDDDEYLLSSDPMRSANCGVSLQPSRGPTSAACKGKSRASARDGLVHDTTRGLQREGRDLRPHIRGKYQVRPDGYEALDELDEHGTKTFGRGSENDYDSARCGLGVARGGKEKAGANTIGREKFDDGFWKMRPGDFDSDRDTKRHDNLETEGRGKSGRKVFVQSAGKARCFDVEAKFAPQNRAETSPELVRSSVKLGREEVRRPLGKKQEVSPHQTGGTYGSPQVEQKTRKSQRSRITKDTSTEEEELEYVLSDTAGSDAIKVDGQTQRRKRARYSRDRSDNDGPDVVFTLSEDGDKGIIRRNTPPKTRRDATRFGRSRGNEDTSFPAHGAEEISQSGKNPPEVNGRKCSSSKRSDSSQVRPNQEDMSEDEDIGGEKSSAAVRRRGRPRKSTETKVEPRGKKNSGKKNSAANKDASSQRKARNDARNAKNSVKIPEKSSRKIKANVVINLDDDDSDEIEDDAPIQTKDLGAERNRARRLREIERKEDRVGDKVANQFQVHEDVILPARLRSQKNEKKKPPTAGTSLPVKRWKVEAKDCGVQRFAQRPLYLDVLDDNIRSETQVEGGAVAEEQLSLKAGGDLDSDLGSTKYSVSALGENHAVVDLQDQPVIPLGWVLGADAKMGSASGIGTAGEVVVEPIPMDSVGHIGRETAAEHTSVDGHDTSLHEAVTESDRPDKTRNLTASGEEANSENLKLKVDSQACDNDVAICTGATQQKTLETIQ